jgi:hypothetical protein
MGKNLKQKVMPFFVTLLLLASILVILPSSNVLAAPAIDEVSKTDDLTCGQKIWVNASGLTEDEKYYVKIWDGTANEDIEDERADSDGEVSIEFNVPYRGTLGAYNLSFWDDTTELDNTTIYINNTFRVKYLVGDDEVDNYLYDLQYWAPDQGVTFEVYNWTGSKYELFEEEVNITVFLPDGSIAPRDPAEINSAPYDILYKVTDTGKWNFDYLFNYTDTGDNLEVDYHVYVLDTTNGNQLSNLSLPIKVDLTTTNLPDDAEWGDTVTVEGYVLDGNGDGIADYTVALYSPSGDTYVRVDSDTTYASGRYSLSGSTDEDGASAGTWYVGTYMTGGTYRIDETDSLDITDFIMYDSFMVGTQDTARVKLESPDELVDGFVQTLNISVYNNSDWDDDAGTGDFYYDQMWVHLTGLDCYYMGTEYDDDDIVVLGNFTDNGTGYSDNEKYAYYEFNITFNETGAGTIMVTYDHNNTYYEDSDSLEANITGSTSISVGAPDDMTLIVNDMVDEVSVTSVSSCCKRNATSTITIEVFGDQQSDHWNASLTILGCGVDIEIDEEDAQDDGYWVSEGVYEVDISPKYAGTITITAENDTENKTVSKDFSVSGLFGTVTTANGDDKEISVETTEKITMTITNGQYADVYLCYYDSDWANPECLNDTTGDATEGNGLNGVFEFTPDVDDIDHVGYIVCAANAGSYWMYDVVEVAPIHDLYLEIRDPTNTSLQTLTVGMEHSWEFRVLEGANGSVVSDVDSVTAEVLDEDGDTVQTFDLEEKTGNIWYMDDFIPHFQGRVVITAVNNTDENEHDGNMTFMAEYAVITFSPEAATAGIDLENITVTVTAVDANGLPIPEGTRFYVNVEEVNDTQDIDADFTLDEDGVGEFDIAKVGDNKTKINLTLQDVYDDGYMGNLTDGFFMIDFPVFLLDPETIYIGQSNLVTITAKDYNGDPIPNINLTLLPSIVGILSSQPDPVQTDADGMVELSISPTASGKLNVTIARNIRYVGGRLNWTNAVVTDTYVTVTSIQSLKVALSQSPVYEGQSFTVTVTTQTGVVVSGADVEFAGTTVQTDSSGKAGFTAPDPGVESVVYTISVEKTGYVSVDKTVTVIKVYDISIVGPDSAPAAGESFTVTILAKGSPLAGATVTFNGKTSTSGGDGKVSLTAPSSEGDYTVTASFPNYDDGSLTVKISAGQVPGFELVSLVVALGVAFVLLRRRR